MKLGEAGQNKRLFGVRAFVVSGASSRRAWLFIAVIAATVISVLVWWAMGLLQAQVAVPTQAPAAKQTQATVKPMKLKFAAMGDMLAHDSVVSQARNENGYNFSQYFASIRNNYKDSDLVFCNPETPAAGDSLGISGYPVFNAPTEFARDLRSGGCNVINLATNHIFDKGQAGIDQTRQVWDQQKPLLISGANRLADEQNTISVTTKNGIKIAFVAFADFSNNSGYAAHSINFYHDKTLVERLMKAARDQADVVIVSAHWGTEDSTAVNADQQAAARQFSDLGADVIIGTGPHVLQKVEWLTGANGHKSLVWYSIGNMLSSQLAIDELTGVIARFTIEKAAQGSITIGEIEATPTFMSYEWSPTDKQASNLAARHNLQLAALRDAKDRIAPMFGSSYDERLKFVTTTLGEVVSVTP